MRVLLLTLLASTFFLHGASVGYSAVVNGDFTSGSSNWTIVGSATIGLAPPITFGSGNSATIANFDGAANDAVLSAGLDITLGDLGGLGFGGIGEGSAITQSIFLNPGTYTFSFDYQFLSNTPSLSFALGDDVPNDFAFVSVQEDGGPFGDLQAFAKATGDDAPAVPSASANTNTALLGGELLETFRLPNAEQFSANYNITTAGNYLLGIGVTDVVSTNVPGVDQIINSALLVDNVSFSSASGPASVPEPTSMALVVASFAGLGFRRWKSRGVDRDEKTEV
ncbi:PEP-CTERM sorting domain-containing protein [Rubinisphaera sp. JC750]|uniref:PEP-CTERM sorting domain-containing protein n=1 Tax=Rubinisphaera sp. JC750 TaxID=2898658 RepID=UPI001F3D3041|nr:PEP-CTERM sorting domain-containing protein [Rubinisphaera sp. JC750]